MMILGAGMSGMLAGQYFRSLQPIIWEKKPSLPNNHKALLRFRSDSVSTLTGIPFQKVKVYKGYNYKGNSSGYSDIFLNNSYSFKVTGKYSPRSVIDLSSCERYIAPENFINLLSQGLNIIYDHGASTVIEFDDERPIISTIPVTALADILSYDLGCTLHSIPIWTITALIKNPCDVYQTVYYPNKKLNMYRLSITGNKVIAEFISDPGNDIYENVKFLNHFLELDFGIDADLTAVNKWNQEYGKLIPHSGNEVKEFIHWASTRHNIYSLGRWATHRQLLMDDVVKDIKVIDRLIRSKGYSR